MALLDNKKGVDASQPPAPSGGGMLSPLKHKAFAAIWSANVASSFGGVIQSVGASWLMTSIDPSPTMVALVQASAVAPIMILSILGGALADIYDRRAIMLIAQIFMAVISAALAVIVFLGPISPWALLTFTFLIGTGTALYTPSWQSSIPDQVPRSEVAGAVSLNAFAFNVARSLAPAIGGAIIAVAGAFSAFAINALSYVGLIVALFKWRPQIAKPELPSEPLHRAISAGLRYVSLSPAINSVLLRATLFGFAAGGLWALMPLIAHDILHSGPLIYGILLGAFGAGAMAGALATARLRARFKSDSIINCSTAGFGFGAIVAGLSPWLPLTAPAMFIAGLSWVLTLSTFNVSVQMSSPRWVAGRSISIYQVAVFGGLALGSAFWGFVGNNAGLAQALCLSGVAMLLSLIAALKFKMPALDGAALDPWRRRQTSDPILELTPRSGPIAITIEYIVDTSNAHNFVVAMQEMGRIRRRDGARRWTLTQDIDNPEHWIEQYRSPTWLDHLHRQIRPTIADEAARAHALSFHKGETAPIVHRLIERPSADVFGESALAHADALDAHGPQH